MNQSIQCLCHQRLLDYRDTRIPKKCIFKCPLVTLFKILQHAQNLRRNISLKYLNLFHSVAITNNI